MGISALLLLVGEWIRMNGVTAKVMEERLRTAWTLPCVLAAFPLRSLDGRKGQAKPQSREEGDDDAFRPLCAPAPLRENHVPGFLTGWELAHAKTQRGKHGWLVVLVLASLRLERSGRENHVLGLSLDGTCLTRRREGGAWTGKGNRTQRREEGQDRERANHFASFCASCGKPCSRLWRRRLADSWFRDVRLLDHEGHEGEGGRVR